MPRVVVEIAQAGYDLRNASDYQKTFSTQSASLLIGKKLFIDVDHVSATIGTSTKIYDHNLGYPPVHFIMVKKASGSLQYAMGSNFNISVDETSVYVTSQGAAAPNDTFFITLMRRSLLTEYTSDSASSQNGLPRSGQSPVAMKIMAPGKLITDTDPRNAVVDTDYKTMLVHKSGVLTKVGSSTGIYESVTHNLGYPPMFFIYFSYATPASEVGKFRQILGSVGTSQVSGVHKVNNSVLNIGETVPGRYAYLILKDPSL